MNDLTNLKQMNISEEIKRWNILAHQWNKASKPWNAGSSKENKEFKYKINAYFVLRYLSLECYREQRVAFSGMLPIAENSVPLCDADYILYMHPYARIQDASEFVLKELRLVDKYRKKGAEIIVLGKSANTQKKLNGEIKNITFWGDHFVVKLAKRFDLDIKERYFVYDDTMGHLAIWPVDGCLQKCGFCRRNYMNIKFESIPLEIIKENLDFIKKEDPRKMKYISLRAENLTEYGMDIYGEPKLDELLDLINSYDEVESISFPIGMTIGEITPNILDALCRLKKIQFIRLHLETGSDRLLDLIGKKHTNERAIQIYHAIQKFHPETDIHSNVMIGLPTEEITDIYSLADLIVEAKPNQIYCVFYGNNPDQPLAKLPQMSETLREYHLKILIQQLKKKVDFEMLFIYYRIFKNQNAKKIIKRKKEMEEYFSKTGLGMHYNAFLKFK